MSLVSSPITVYANSFEISKIPTQVYYQIHGEHSSSGFTFVSFSYLFNSWFVDSPFCFFERERTFFLLIEFKPKVEEVHRRRELIHHLQNVVAPDFFNRRIVYDGDSIAYFPGRLPSLAGHNSGNV
jgi:N-terminal domain of argonaute